MSTDAEIRSIAFYLPQFHPTAENDEWWGAGFTEWTNTAAARPLFPGHRQPNLPSELGFYDLRVAESRQAQADLAREYGLSGFCYWHYWFGGGQRMLQRPFEEVLSSGEPDLGFCLGWANHSWTRTWSGAEHEVLRHQTYPGRADEAAHFEAVLPAFRDSRYLTVDGRPIFYIFRPQDIPDVRAFLSHWRQLAQEAGLPGLYFVAEMTVPAPGVRTYASARADGFDAAAWLRLPVSDGRSTRLGVRVGKRLGLPEIREYAKKPEPQPVDDFLQPVVYPCWDNTPRSGRRGLVVRGSSPERFQRHVEAAVRLVRRRPPAERIVWVKSWNEWAEGNHLEPDMRVGRGWLEALRSGLRGGSTA